MDSQKRPRSGGSCRWFLFSVRKKRLALFCTEGCRGIVVGRQEGVDGGEQGPGVAGAGVDDMRVVC